MSGVHREQFCQEYIRNGGDATAAYDFAFPPKTTRVRNTAKVAACRLMKEPGIRDRIAELGALAAAQYAEKRSAAAGEIAESKIADEDRFGGTVAGIALQLDEDRLFARENGQGAAAVSATVAKGKLFGLFIDKKDITIGMRPDEARAVIAALLARFGKPPA